MEDRESLLRQDGTLIGLATAGLINGSHVSPWFDVMAAPIGAILAGFYISSPVLIFYFVSMSVAVFTVLIAGVPAAIYEQSKGETASTSTSLMIWLLAALTLSLPALAKMVGFW